MNPDRTPPAQRAGIGEEISRGARRGRHGRCWSGVSAIAGPGCGCCCGPRKVFMNIRPLRKASPMSKPDASLRRRSRSVMAFGVFTAAVSTASRRASGSCGASKPVGNFRSG